jgi:hypothetical protein
MKKDAEKLSFLKTASFYPMCISCMSNDEIFVCLGIHSPVKDAKDLVKIRWFQIEPKYGKLKRELKLNPNEHQITNPVSVTVNALGDIIIINQDKDNGTNLVCLKSDGSVKCRYPKSASSICHFVGVACLSDGTSVILDQSEPSLHLIDVNGSL